MNERIKLLAAKAGFGGSGDPYERQAFNIPMFVELIKQAIYDDVKEELIDDDIISNEPEQFREYLKGCNGGTVDALCHIKNFGVDIDP